MSDMSGNGYSHSYSYGGVSGGGAATHHGNTALRLVGNGAPASAPSTALERVRTLIVDDSPAAREVLARKTFPDGLESQALLPKDA